MRRLAFAIVLGTVLVTGRAARTADATIPWDQAEQHVGETATVEGRVLGIHCSPTSCLLAFDPTFNRFTAVVQAKDFKSLPPEKLNARLRRAAGACDRQDPAPREKTRDHRHHARRPASRHHGEGSRREARGGADRHGRPPGRDPRPARRAERAPRARRRRGSSRSRRQIDEQGAQIAQIAAIQAEAMGQSFDTAAAVLRRAAAAARVRGHAHDQARHDERRGGAAGGTTAVERNVARRQRSSGTTATAGRSRSTAGTARRRSRVSRAP